MAETHIVGSSRAHGKSPRVDVELTSAAKDYQWRMSHLTGAPAASAASKICISTVDYILFARHAIAPDGHEFRASTRDYHASLAFVQCTPCALLSLMLVSPLLYICERYQTWTARYKLAAQSCSLHKCTDSALLPTLQYSAISTDELQNQVGLDPSTLHILAANALGNLYSDFDASCA